MIAPQELLSVPDNSTLEPAMAENKTTQLNPTPVEIVEELSPEEAADRQQLELKVERAWDEALKQKNPSPPEFAKSDVVEILESALSCVHLTACAASLSM